jgi:hypothetical protein
MKTYGEEGGQLHTSLTSALGGGVWCRSGKLLLALASTAILRYGSRGIHDHIFLPHDSGSSATSHLGPFNPRGKNPRYPLDKRLGGPQSRSGRCAPTSNRNLILLSSPLVTTLTELSWLGLNQDLRGKKKHIRH